jgi:putative endonuclease
MHAGGSLEHTAMAYREKTPAVYILAGAIEREHRIKEWRRQWKIRLIESMNPEWIDLFNEERSSTAPQTWRGARAKSASSL